MRIDHTHDIQSTAYSQAAQESAFDQRDKQGALKRAVKRLESLGYKVNLEAA